MKIRKIKYSDCKELYEWRNDPVTKSMSKESDNINYEVDGLSGATLTCNGVTNLIAYWMGSDGFLNFINKRQMN